MGKSSLKLFRQGYLFASRLNKLPILLQRGQPAQRDLRAIAAPQAQRDPPVRLARKVKALQDQQVTPVLRGQPDPRDQQVPLALRVQIQL